jgi:hypothetical protein
MLNTRVVQQWPDFLLLARRRSRSDLVATSLPGVLLQMEGCIGRLVDGGVNQPPQYRCTEGEVFDSDMMRLL